jgi:hypothetical protein
MLAGCSTPAVVNTGEPPATSTSSIPPPLPPLNNAGLVRAFDFVAHVDGRATGYYFTTPSGRWRCAIVTREVAGCQSSRWPSAMGITGEPDTVAGADGEPATPNAIVVERTGDAHFAALAEPRFELDPGPAKVLQFDEVLAAAGFRCNVQEQSGVSCLSERSGNGFTFSADGFTTRYTDLPVG